MKTTISLKILDQIMNPKVGDKIISTGGIVIEILKVNESPENTIEVNLHGRVQKYELKKFILAALRTISKGNATLQPVKSKEVRKSIFTGSFSEIV
jgi:preprotein translocase subunit YajC